MLKHRRLLHDFNPLPSCEGRPKSRQPPSKPRYFNPLPSCEGRRRLLVTAIIQRKISIHSPHARGDNRRALPAYLPSISIHSPHARGDSPYFSSSASSPHFNPLPSCEGRLHNTVHLRRYFYFNPLPSCEGRRRTVAENRREFAFQSTPLMRGETIVLAYNSMFDFISIHSPHARGDQARQCLNICAA